MPRMSKPPAESPTSSSAPISLSERTESNHLVETEFLFLCTLSPMRPRLAAHPAQRAFLIPARPAPRSTHPPSLVSHLDLSCFFVLRAAHRSPASPRPERAPAFPLVPLQSPQPRPVAPATLG